MVIDSHCFFMVTSLNQGSLLIKQMPCKGITEGILLVFLLIMVSCWFIRLTFLITE